MYKYLCINFVGGTGPEDEFQLELVTPLEHIDEIHMKKDKDGWFSIETPKGVFSLNANLIMCMSLVGEEDPEVS